MLMLAVLAAPSRPLLTHARPTRVPQFSSLPLDTHGCDASKIRSFLVHQDAPFRKVECVADVLHVDGAVVPSVQLGASRQLGFYHEASDGYVVVAKLPYGTFPNEPVGGRTGTIFLQADNFTRLFATSLTPQLYDIKEVDTGNPWYTFTVEAAVGSVGIEEHYGLLETDTDYNLVNATYVYSSLRQTNTYNISFNRNWPDSGNGEYIAADLYRVDGPIVFNQFIEGVAYKYNATKCACSWNGTACTNFCEANSTHLGFRGDPVDIKGELRDSSQLGTVVSPPPLTPAQLEQLREVSSVGEALVSAGKIDSRPLRDVGVCDAKAAVTAIIGITSTSSSNDLFNGFWGTLCGTATGPLIPLWKQRAHEYMTKAMLWSLANKSPNICAASRPDACSFCHVSEAEANQCLKSPDGKASPASQTTVLDLFVQQGQVPVPTCDSCDSSSSCLEDCIPKEIVDAALDGPLAHNISDYLMDLAYGTLSLQYLTVPKGNGEKVNGVYTNFDDWIWHTCARRMPFDRTRPRDRLHDGPLPSA
mmetsp:Transcript_846/g.2613  ORF Transcript_846/g.2613 Transcript_846/m.2613 type:complete len:532 (+) Transcript_846:105-1700(+)